MIHAVIGQKIKQTQQFTDDGMRIPVTVITAGPCWITQIIDTPKYRNLQLGFGSTKKMSKPMTGHTKKAGLENKPRFLREIRVQEISEDMTLGKQINVADVFQVGDAVRATGISKGKGFASGIKRYGFSGGPRTHGQSDRERAPGSIGSTTTPGRVLKGQRMAGRMGGDTVTVKGLTVISVDPENQTVVIKGLIPGGKNSIILLQKEQ